MKKWRWGRMMLCVILAYALMMSEIIGMPGIQPPVAEASGYTYESVKDAYVRDGAYSSNNYGSSGQLAVKNDPSDDYDRRSYVGFDFSTLPDSVISDAKLRMYVESVSEDPARVVKAYGLSDTDENWKESGSGSITWNNAPISGVYLSEQTIGMSGAWVEWDVTEYIANQQQDQQVSFMLINEGEASTGSTVNFSPREDTGYAPQLIIDATQLASVRLVLSNKNVNIHGSITYRVVSTATTGEQFDTSEMATVTCGQSGKVEIDKASRTIKGVENGDCLLTVTQGGLLDTATIHINDFDSAIRIKGEEVVHEDFEGAVPDSYLPDSDFTVVSDGTSNKALYIQGVGNGVKRTDPIDGAYGSNYIVEADIKQINASAASNGGISIHTRRGDDGKSYVFRYMDILKYDFYKHSYSSSASAIRDRIGIARNEDNNINNWYYGAIYGDAAGPQLGILNTASRNFNGNYYKMTAFTGPLVLEPSPFPPVDPQPPQTPMFNNLMMKVEDSAGVEVGKVETTTFIAETAALAGADRYAASGGSKRYASALTKGKALLQVENTDAYIDNVTISTVHAARKIELFIKDSFVQPNQTTSFEVRAYTDYKNYTIVPSNLVRFDPAPPASLHLNPSTGTMTPDAEGEFAITVVADDMFDPNLSKSYTAKLTVSSSDIAESFGTSGDRKVENPEYMSIPSESLIDDNGNSVYRLNNEVSRLFGNEDWTNYSVEGKVKIVNRKLDPADYSSAFEIIMRRKAIQGEYDGQGGFPFVYHIGDTAQSNYMRISGSAGENLDIEDGEWHTFKAEASHNQYVFSLNGITQYYSMGGLISGGFSFRAQNSEVYLDDLVIRKIEGEPYSTSTPVSLSSDRSQVTAVKYDVLEMGEITTLKAGYVNGKSKYVTTDAAIAWSIAAGADKVELFEDDTIRFKPSVQNGDTVTMRAAYGAATCDIVITVAVPTVSEMDYVQGGTEKRQDSLIYKLRSLYEEGIQKPGSMGYARLPEVFGKMMLNPEEREYTNEVEWMIDLVEYDEGRGASGRAGGAADFNLAQMIQLYKKLDSRVNVSSQAWNEMINLLKTTNYSVPEETMSENHKLMYYASGYIVSETWPDLVMWNGATGLENQTTYKNYIRDWMNRRLKLGMGEYDSVSYYGVDLGGLSMLYTFAEDSNVKAMAADMLDYLYGDMLVDSIDGNIGGAHSRTYVIGSTYYYAITNYAMDILFDTGIVDVDEKYRTVNVQAAPIPLSSYRPSEVLYYIARDRTKRFDNKERKAIYVIPDDNPPTTDSLKKYNHVTPDYTLGSVVQQEIVTPSFQGTQEIPWSLTFGKSMEATVFDSHPGGYETDTHSHHAYFHGSRGDVEYKYFQENNVMIGMHQLTIPSKPQFTHFFIPKKALDEVVDDSGSNGWIFIRKDDVYAAIKPLKDGIVSNVSQYDWTLSGKWADFEAKINSSNTAFVIEVADSAEFTGSFGDFRTAILSNESTNPILYDIQNGYSIQYTGLNGKTLTLDYETDQRKIDGIAQDFSLYDLHESPYMNADWNTGTISITYGPYSKTINLFP